MHRRIYALPKLKVYSFIIDVRISAISDKKANERFRRFIERHDPSYTSYIRLLSKELIEPSELDKRKKIHQTKEA